jgi:hypothetical protein
MGFLGKMKDTAKMAAGQSSVGGIGEQAAYRDKAMKINQSGVDTPATLKSLEATGRKDLGGAEYSITVEVRPAGGAPYTTTFTQAMVEQQLPAYQVGSEITVRVDPDDQNSMLLWGGAA